MSGIKRKIARNRVNKINTFFCKDCMNIHATDENEAKCPFCKKKLQKIKLKNIGKQLG